MSTKYKIGQEVIVSTKEIPDKRGIVRFVGKIEGKAQEYTGVELEEPFGKNNGDYEGKSYFKVEKKSDKGQFFGVFVKATSLKPAPEAKKPPATGPKTTKPAPVPAAGSKSNKLSNELLEQQSGELLAMKEELQAAYEKIRYFETLDHVKEIESLKERVRELEENKRDLKLQVEEVRYRTDEGQSEKTKEYAQRLAYFQKQKEAAEREVTELKEELQSKAEELELQQGANDEQTEMIEDLTFKLQALEAKYDKSREELQAKNAQLKNAEMLGTGKSSEELQESITTLNEMVAMLEGELEEEKEKVKGLEAQLESNSTRLSDVVKLERQLKARREEVQAMRAELQAFSESEDFIEKLTFQGFKKDEEIKDLGKRVKEFAEKVKKLQEQAAQAQDVIDLQTEQIDHLQQQISKHAAEKEEARRHLALITQQKNKYKKRVQQLNENNTSLLQSMDDRQQESVIKNYFTTDVYQHKYYELIRLHQITDQRLLQYQLQMATVRQYAGAFVANLIDTLPEAFTSRLHPLLLALLLRLSSINHKLYLLFDLLAAALTQKSELFSADQQTLAGFYLILLDHIPLLYGSLLKLELAIVSADGQEDVAEILASADLKEQLPRVEAFTMELLERVSTQSVDPQADLDVYIESGQILDKVCEAVRRLPTELATRLELCVETMKAVQQLLSSVEKYRRGSQARELAQVDTMLESFLKLLQEYLRECCTNPHIRLKSDMRSYLSGLDLIVKILREVQLNDSLQELNSLYSEVEDIKMLKDTVLTTQFHLKELVNDLADIAYPTPLSRVHVKLPGRLWQDKLKEMREELSKFESTLAEKAQLERVGAEQRRKILLLEKEIKDRQSTKQLHERRIGELQLKVEQAALLEGEFKRQGDKFRNLEEANKLIEDELAAQSRRKKQLQEELRKTKEKFDIFQTETMMKQKKQKANSLSTEDLSSLAIFKTVLAEAGALRNHATKRKLHQLAFSPLLQAPQQQKPRDSTRRQAMQALADVKIGSDFTGVESMLRRAQFQVAVKAEKEFVVGRLVVRSGRDCLRVDANATELVSC